MLNFYIDDPARKFTAIPGDLDFERYDLKLRAIHSEEEIIPLFENIIFPGSVIHIVIRKGFIERNEYNCQILFDYLNRNYRNRKIRDLGSFEIFSYIVSNDQ